MPKKKLKSIDKVYNTYTFEEDGILNIYHGAVPDFNPDDPIEFNITCEEM